MRSGRKSNLPNISGALGAEIRKRRVQLGMSQDELAFLAETHRTYVGAIERGEKAITVEKLAALARALNCLPSSILTECDL